MKTTVTLSHPTHPDKQTKISKNLTKIHQRIITNVRFLKIFVFIQRPSKYHPTAFKVSSVDLQSIIRWKAKYHPTEVHILKNMGKTVSIHLKKCIFAPDIRWKKC